MQDEGSRSVRNELSRRGFLHSAAAGPVVTVAGQRAIASEPHSASAKDSKPYNEADRLLRYGGEFGGSDPNRALRNDSSDQRRS